MDLKEIGNSVVEKIKSNCQDENIVSEFMQNRTEIAKVTKYIADRLKDRNIALEILLNDEAECLAITNFWVSLFLESEKLRKSKNMINPANDQAAEGKYYDPYHTPW